MDNNNSQGPVEGEELKKLEEELKTIGNPPQETAPDPQVTPKPIPPAVPVQEPQSAVPPYSEAPTTPEPKSSKVMMMAIGLLVLSLVGVGAYLIGNKNSAQTACTLEAKICPDGSSVGRSGPYCEFATCPSFSPTPSPFPTETSSPTPSSSASTTPSATPSASSSASPSVTPTATP